MRSGRAPNRRAGGTRTLARFSNCHESEVASTHSVKMRIATMAGGGGRSWPEAELSVVGLAATQSAEQRFPWEQSLGAPQAQACSSIPALHSEGTARMPQMSKPLIRTRRNMRRSLALTSSAPQLGTKALGTKAQRQARGPANCSRESSFARQFQSAVENLPRGCDACSTEEPARAGRKPDNQADLDMPRRRGEPTVK